MPSYFRIYCFCFYYIQVCITYFCGTGLADIIYIWYLLSPCCGDSALWWSSGLDIRNFLTDLLVISSSLASLASSRGQLSALLSSCSSYLGKYQTWDLTPQVMSYLEICPDSGRCPSSCWSPCCCCCGCRDCSSRCRTVEDKDRRRTGTDTEASADRTNTGYLLER